MINLNMFPRDKCPICGTQMSEPVECGNEIMTSKCNGSSHYGFDFYKINNKIYYVGYSPLKYSVFLDIEGNKLTTTVPNYGKVLLTMKITDLECQTLDQLLAKIETLINFS